MNPSHTSSRAPRRRLDVELRRAELVAHGIAVFSARPYDEVTIDDLARGAGVSKGLLYHYFPTKRDFYVAALEQASSELLAGALAAEGASPGERLRKAIATYLDFVERHGQAYVALMRAGIGYDPEVATILDRTRTAFVARIALEVAATPRLVRTAMRGWIGFVEATALDWLERRAEGDGAPEREAVIDLLVSVLFHAVAAAART